MGTYEQQERTGSRLLRPREVEERLGISREGVARLRRRGVLPTVYVGHSPRIRLSDVEKFVAGLPTVPPEREDAA
jgi:excisionase family DNA binding protein